MSKIEVSPVEATKVSEGSERAAAQKLDDATYEPKALVERTGDYKQSESIQGNLTAVIHNTAAAAHADLGSAKANEKRSGSDSPMIKGTGERDTVRGQESVTRTDLSTPKASDQGAEERKSYKNETGSNPPRRIFSEDKKEPDEPGGGAPPTERTSAAGGEVKASSGGQVSITPINLPNIADTSGGEVKGSGGGQVSITPINLPDVADGAGGEIKGPGGQISITPINLPDTADTSNGKFKGPGGDPSALRASAPVPQPQPDTADSGIQLPGGYKDHVGQTLEEGRPHGDTYNPSDKLMAKGASFKGKAYRQEPAQENSPYEASPEGAGNGESYDAAIPKPNARDENTFGRAQSKPAAEAGTLGNIDTATGQVRPPADGSGANSENNTDGTQAGPSIVMRAAGNSSTTRGAASDAPASIEQPIFRQGATHLPQDAYVPIEPPILSSASGHGTQTNGSSSQQQLDNQFANQALNAIGMGTHGFLTNTPASAQGEAHGYGPGAPEGKMPVLTDSNIDQNDGYHSSGGGAPVNNYGFGNIGSPADENKYRGVDGNQSGQGSGSGDVTIHDHQKSPEQGAFVLQVYDSGAKCVPAASFDGVICKTSGGAYIAWKINTIDGGSPMPYTGNWSPGAFHPKDPSTIGGSSQENDSGRIMPVIRHGGQGSGGGGTNSTDGTSSNWDDGHYYGTIFGGPDGNPGAMDPGGLDYDKLNTSAKLHTK